MKKIAWFDVGANDGNDSIWVAINNPHLQVYGFEPTPEMYTVMEQRSIGVPNYHVIRKAVSDFNGTATFNVAGQGDWGCSSLLEFSEKSQTEWPGRTDFKVTTQLEVEVIRLDEFIVENGIDEVEYIHIDTQGSDLNVLRGLGEKLSIVRGGVMEAAGKNEVLYNNQNGESESVEFLNSKGFTVVDIRSNDEHRNEVNIHFVNPSFY